MVLQVKTKNEFDEIIAKNSKVAVDFTATWCPPCRKIGPVFVSHAANFPGITFIKVDVDENSATSEYCGIKAMPTFHFYKDGTKVSELVGADENKLKTELEKL